MPERSGSESSPQSRPSGKAAEPSGPRGRVRSGLRGLAARVRGNRVAAVVATCTVGAVVAASVVVGLGAAGAAPTPSDVGAWLADNSRGSVSHVNGLSGQVDARVNISGAAGGQLQVNDNGSSILVMDQHTGKLTRIDPAQLTTPQTYDHHTPGKQPVQGKNTAWLVDAANGVVQPIDRTTLAPLGSVDLHSRPLGQAVADNNDTLWVPLPATGQVVPIRGTTAGAPIAVSEPGKPLLLTMTDSKLAVTDPADHKLVLISDDGTSVERSIDLPVELSTSAPGKVLAPDHSETSVVPVLSSDNGTLVLVDVALGSVQATPLTVQKHDYGPPQTLGARVYVADRTTGALLVYNTAQAQFEPQVKVTGVPGPLETMVKQGLLWASDSNHAMVSVVDAQGKARSVYYGNKPQTNGSGPSAHTSMPAVPEGGASESPSADTPGPSGSPTAGSPGESTNASPTSSSSSDSSPTDDGSGTGDNPFEDTVEDNGSGDSSGGGAVDPIPPPADTTPVAAPPKAKKPPATPPSHKTPPKSPPHTTPAKPPAKTSPTPPKTSPTPPKTSPTPPHTSSSPKPPPTGTKPPKMTAPGTPLAKSGVNQITITFKPASKATPNSYTLGGLPAGMGVTPKSVPSDGAFSFVVTGGSCSKTYSFYVTANYTGGKVNSKRSTAVHPCLAPGKPTDLKASVVDSKHVELTWTAPTNNPGGKIKYKATSTGASSVTSEDTTVTFKLKTALQSGKSKKFTFSVTAKNGAETSKSTAKLTVTLTYKAKAKAAAWVSPGDGPPPPGGPGTGHAPVTSHTVPVTAEPRRSVYPSV